MLSKSIINNMKNNNQIEKLNFDPLKKPFQITNAINSCYIDSLLISLFYFNSSICTTLLKQDPKEPYAIYLQELILNEMILPARNCQTITFDTISLIRNVCSELGWKSNNEEYLEQQDVSEFYEFLMDKFGGILIEVQRETIFQGFNNKDISNMEKLPFIPLSINKEKSIVYIKNMLHNWMHDNIIDVEKDIVVLENNNKKKMKRNLKGLGTYKLINIPDIVAVGINRFDNSQKRINNDVIIQYAIDPFQTSNNNLSNNLNYQGIRWNIHAIICHKGPTPKNGHYYAILYNQIYTDNNKENKWYLFDDLVVPCIKEISMNDETIISKIKKECVFIIYRL